MALRISPRWVQEFCNIKASVEDLGAMLSESGFETEIIEDIAIDERLVIGKVLSVSKHPSADKLNVCQVDLGKEIVNIVCGCPTVVNAQLVIVAPIGAKLPGLEIKKVSLRGVDSEGMICSLEEIGLLEESKGIYHVDENLKIGDRLVDVLMHDQRLLEIDITPNRGDALSVYGIARDLSASQKKPLKDLQTTDLSKIKDAVLFELKSKDVPSYAASTLRVDTKKKTPLYMLNRLRQAGMGSNHPVVDVLNYIMLEIGQPMHAFNQETLRLPLIVKDKVEDKVLLLDGNVYETKPWDLLVCDQKIPHALAGIMGGYDSRMQPDTEVLQLESAMFSPKRIAKSLRRSKLQSDASYRYERGVASDLNEVALGYAILLLEKYLGASVENKMLCQNLPAKQVIELEEAAVNQCLGIEIPKDSMLEMLTSLGLEVKASKDKFSVTIPYHRHDLMIAEDLIEEIARLHGYNNIPLMPMSGVLTPVLKTDNPHDMAKTVMQEFGYHEVLQFSFVSKRLIDIFSEDVDALEIDNPIHAEYGFMRTNLWQSLILAAQYNYQRQHQSMKLFEMGSVFHKKGKKIEEPLHIAALAMGQIESGYLADQSSVDYYHMQSLVLGVLRHYGNWEVSFKRSTFPGLHPNQSADIFIGKVCVGRVGMIHPKVSIELGLPELGLYSIDLDALPKKETSEIVKPSKYPAIYRDITVSLDKNKAVQDLESKFDQVDYLKDYQLIEIYPLNDTTHNITWRFKFQSTEETLSDKQIELIMQKIKKLLS